MDIHTKENFLNKLGLDRSGKRGSWFRFVHFLLENLEQKNNFPVFFLLFRHLVVVVFFYILKSGAEKVKTFKYKYYLNVKEWLTIDE